ncbi:type IV pilin protein [Sulfuriflexus sp.]|uniref:type IV pilin protein n=1 Tax=Sulfuriflexus sp. TaxID=2015443 RepID=UPI0028CCCD02|nr:type IV pilin protein [Sulfuriflexus sp.]MDT8403756.1 type IV pilin protein [Sulfuriflexus sp.]
MKKQIGFTLIELMITVAIVSILAAIAIPAYQDQVVKTRRTDGKAGLTNAAQALERCFSQNGKYTTCTGHGNGTSIDSEESWYKIGIATTASTYTLTATPQGAQATKDTKCKNLTLTETGLKGKSGTGTVAECW